MLRGRVLSDTYRLDEADTVLQACVAALDEAPNLAPDDSEAHNVKGGALVLRGRVLVELSRPKVAERAYADAVVVFDEVLSLASDVGDSYNAYINKGNALAARGDLLAGLSRPEEAERAYIAAILTFYGAINQALKRAVGYNNMGAVLVSYADLLVKRYRLDEAARAVQASISALDEALSHAPEDPWTHVNRGNAFRTRGDLLVELARPEKAEKVYADAQQTPSLRHAPLGDPLQDRASPLAPHCRGEVARREAHRPCDVLRGDLLIAQALAEGLHLLSIDSEFGPYPVNVMW